MMRNKCLGGGMQDPILDLFFIFHQFVINHYFFFHLFSCNSTLVNNLVLFNVAFGRIRQDGNCILFQLWIRAILNRMIMRHEIHKFVNFTMDLLIVNCQLDSNNPVLASSIAKFIKKHSTDISSVFMLQHCYSWIDVRYASNWMFVDDNKHATPGQRVEKVQGQPMIEGRVVKYIFGPIPKLDEKITLIEDVYLFGTPGVGFYPCIVDAIREAGLLTNLIVEEIDSEHAPNMFAFSSESKLLVVGD